VELFHGVDEQVGAFSKHDAVETARIERVIATVKPALRALSSRIRKSHCATAGRNRCNPVNREAFFDERGFMVRNDYATVRDSTGNSGTLEGCRIYPLTDGRIARVTRSGTFSYWQGEPEQWEATFEILTAKEYADEYDLAPLLASRASTRRVLDSRWPMAPLSNWIVRATSCSRHHARRSMRLMAYLKLTLLLGLSAVTSVALLARPVWAVVNSNDGAFLSANIGVHPTYGSSFSGFWRDGEDYALLTDGQSTYVSAPSAAGAILFRGANSASPGVRDPGGGFSRGYIDSASNFAVAGQVSGNHLQMGTGAAGNSYDNAIGTNVATGHAALSVSNTSNTPDSSFIASSNSNVALIAQGDAIGLLAAGCRTTSSNNGASVGLWAIVDKTNPTSTAVHADAASLNSGGIAVMAETNSTAAAQPAVYAKSGSATSGLAYYGVGNITITGNNASKAQGGSWNGTSDIRTKENVEPFTRGLDALEQVSPISYSFNGLGETIKDGTRYVGVAAQELQKVMPAMVGHKTAKLHESDSSPTEILQVDPSDFVYVLINSVKELDREVKSLRAELDERARRQ
jgi:Chaperone of endosialidase